MKDQAHSYAEAAAAAAERAAAAAAAAAQAAQAAAQAARDAAEAEEAARSENGRAKRAPKHRAEPGFSWAGALRDLRDEYTSVELQHSIGKSRAGKK